MFYTNCDCLSHIKTVELESYIQQRSSDILALTDVLPKNSLFDINKDVYTCFSSDLTKGRGVLLYVKDHIPAIEVMQIINFSESAWCKINLSGGDKLIIGCVYRSPNSTRENNSNLFEALRDIVRNNPSHCLTIGDFNIKEIDWNNLSSIENENHISTMFLECLRNCFLFQHVTKPTRYRSQNVPSVLDLILTNEEGMM